MAPDVDPFPADRAAAHALRRTVRGVVLVVVALLSTLGLGSSAMALSDAGASPSTSVRVASVVVDEALASSDVVAPATTGTVHLTHRPASLRRLRRRTSTIGWGRSADRRVPTVAADDPPPGRAPPQ